MKKIIGLYGRRSSGKTTTLNLLIGLFNKNGNLDDPITIRDDQGKMIVITPGGDDEEVIKKNLEAFEKAEGDILVTATRTKGQTASYLSNYFPENSVEITWIKKHYAEIRTDLVNQAQAEDIKAVIDSIIDEWDK
ncbi:MAG: hypothetical protein HXN16_03770 [Porphyromonas sp.]|jgi:hypothetical protein|uniref:ATP-binding protein n=1 Tax=Porphyromonas sp. TaxID=1924944 RepID=UPI001CB438CC|nr:ATP-binding protein [Porphyromonas sp.]MBF1389851.1 hypothetical protein [Porphyromonas sp.]